MHKCHKWVIRVIHVNCNVLSATGHPIPLLMAVSLNILGLVPIMLSTGVGADVAQRVSAPLWGGLITLTIMTLLVIPAIYAVWRGRRMAST